MTPDIFEIPWHIAVVNDKQAYTKFIFNIVRQECLCSHRAIDHSHEMYKRLDRLTDELIFIECKHKYDCGCKLFKRDNLRYLEELAAEKGEGNESTNA